MMLIGTQPRMHFSHGPVPQARIQDARRALGLYTRPWLVICHPNSVRDGGAERAAQRTR